MGMRYSAEAFFGACVAKSTPLGEKLDKYVDKAGGTPAETETPGVVICKVGCQPTGEVWLTICIDGIGYTFGRETEVYTPRLLTEDPAWRSAIAAFFARLKIKDQPPVGWHFAGSVT